MPLLHRKPFVPLGIPEGLGKNDTVFFCKLTKEMFTDYDEFCERIILCNSLVWSCSLTGRSNLTFQEASNSEEKCKKLLKKFPVELRVPVLYLASLCERRSLLDLTEDVFCFVKDRYFINENLQTSYKDNPEANCKVLAVIAPSEEELKGCSKNDQDKNGDRQYWPPGNKYKYKVEMEEGGEILTLSADEVFRKKNIYNKDKNRLYIKQFVHLSNNAWKLKDTFNEKYGISEVKFSDIFVGEPPTLSPAKSNSAKKTNAKNGKQQTLSKYFKPSPEKRYSNTNSPKKNSPKKEGSGSNSKLTSSQKKKKLTKEQIKAAKEASKVDEAEAKLKAKLEKREEKLKQAKFIKEWNRKREDLECEDLRELPTPLPICSRIPNEYFGDVVMVMEFLHTFSKLLPVKDFFPLGVTLDIMERALVDDEIAGPLADLIQLLLVSVMDLVEQENEEVNDTDVKITAPMVLEKGVADTQAILRQATKAIVWAKHAHAGQQIANLTLDSSTLTEILRLHLLISGCKPSDKVNKWRYNARGGYCTYDDPAVQLKLTDPHIIPQLGRISVCELPIDDKIKIVNCLINQILTYSTLRDTIEDGCQKAKQARLDLKTLIALEQKTERELKKKAKEAAEVAGGGEGGGNSETQTPTTQPEIDRVLRGQGSPQNQANKDELNTVYNAAMMLSHHIPLGEDRAYRKYWKFESLPGLYIEHFEPNPGPCLPKGTPVWSGMELKDDNVESLIKLFESYGPNKENMSGLLSYPYSASNCFSPSKKLLTENNGVHTEKQPVSEIKTETSKLTCWGDATVCPVHSPASYIGGPKWYFFKDRTDIERLIESLNRRGFRERNLLTALTSDKESIIESLEQVPITSLMKSESDEKDDKWLNKIARQYENANMSFPKGTPHDEILESLLREQILETETKISAGGLGSLRVRNRDAWRAAIENHTYDKQCKKLTWGSKNNKEKKEDSSEEADSRCSTPVDMIEDENKPKPQVLDLASAILQLEQSIDYKFLKRPLGLDQKEKDKGQLKMPTPAMEFWETALMQATSFSQLFLYFSSLDNSILWARSALNAFCRICRRRNNPENMLLCDTCNKGHHLYCLKPKLTKIPSGDWHCTTCRPKVSKISSPVKKKRRVFKEESEESDSSENEQSEEEEEQEEEQECSVCNETGAEVRCEQCETLYHLACHNPPVRKAPKGKWYCITCRTEKSNNIQQPNSPKPQTKKSINSAPATPSYETEEELSSEDIEDEDEGEDFIGFKDSEIQASESARLRKSNVIQMNISPERTSRRQSSKAATERIQKFAKQLRSTALDQNDDDEVDEKKASNRRRQSHRRELESDLPLDNAALQEILKSVMRHQDAWPFLRPVTRSEVPDYHLVIKKPMDFGTIKHKLNMLEYTHNSDLIADARLLFKNCFEYNKPGSEVYRAGESLEKLFNNLCEENNLIREEDSEPNAKKVKLY